MNFFTGFFLGFCWDFQNPYFPEYLWIALNISESAKVNRIFVKKAGTYISENYLSFWGGISK